MLVSEASVADKSGTFPCLIRHCTQTGERFVEPKASIALGDIVPVGSASEKLAGIRSLTNIALLLLQPW